MRHSLIVDIQNTESKRFPRNDRKKYLERWVNLDIPVHIAITPYQRDQWQDLEEDIGAVVSRKGSGLLLEGLLHVCAHRNHKIRDPHHQGICTAWFQKSTSYERQLEEIEEGTEFLEKTFGIKPVGYIPSQHLWNHNTVKAVEQANVKYLVTNAMFSNMQPYRESGIIIVPSGSLKYGRTHTPVVHTYYDKIVDQENKVREIEESAVPLSEIPLRKKSLICKLNNQTIWLTKQIRDGKRLITWLVSEEMRRAPDANQIREVRQAQYLKDRAQILGK